MGREEQSAADVAVHVGACRNTVKLFLVLADVGQEDVVVHVTDVGPDVRDEVHDRQPRPPDFDREEQGKAKQDRGGGRDDGRPSKHELFDRNTVCDDPQSWRDDRNKQGGGGRHECENTVGGLGHSKEGHLLAVGCDEQVCKPCRQDGHDDRGLEARLGPIVHHVAAMGAGTLLIGHRSRCGSHRGIHASHLSIEVMTVFPFLLQRRRWLPY